MVEMVEERWRDEAKNTDKKKKSSTFGAGS